MKAEKDLGLDTEKKITEQTERDLGVDAEIDLHTEAEMV